MNTALCSLQPHRTIKTNSGLGTRWLGPPISVLTMVVLIASLQYQAAAQASAQSSAAQTTVKSSLSTEVLAMHARLKRPVPGAPEIFESAAAVSSPNNFNSDQGPGYGPRAGLPGCDVFPAPASVGADVGLSYFGPSPPRPIQVWLDLFSYSIQAS